MRSIATLRRVKRQCFSSSAAAVMPDDYNNPDKPRLQALRDQLRSDKDVVVLQSRKKTQAEQSNDNDNTTIDYRALLESLPRNDTATNNHHFLTDKFGRQHTYVRLSLSERCNLRCTYCMPLEGVPLQPPANLLQTSEILQIAKLLSQAGVTKFRLTGGEPTLRKDLVDIISGLALLQPNQIGITTNGVTLHQQLDDYISAGLNRVNISLDTLDATKFSQLSRRPASYFDRVYRSIQAAHEAMILQKLTHNAVKLNCVVVRGVNEHEVVDFCKLVRDEFPLIAMRFIEYMPFDKNGWQWDKCVPYKELIEAVNSYNSGSSDDEDTMQLVSDPSDDKHDTTKYYRLVSGGSNSITNSTCPRIGFITSMTNNFCAGCNRLRIGADGRLQVCLFGTNSSAPTLSLRDALRQGLTDSELYRVLHYGLQSKHYKLGGNADPEAIRDGASRPMTLIGG